MNAGMRNQLNKIIRVEVNVNAPVEKVWNVYTGPEHIMRWNNASNDWHTPKAENDLRVGGRFLYRMEAKDGSSGFGFSGVYTLVEPHRKIKYIIDDGRNVQVSFLAAGNVTAVTVDFEAEHTNTLDLQQVGWQAILNNFKEYAETTS